MEIENVLTEGNNSMPGFGFSNPLKVIDFIKSALGEELLSLDVSGWDWSVQPFEHIYYAYETVALNFTADASYANAVIVESILNLSCIMMTRDSRLWDTGVYGVVFSGSLPTASKNSKIARINAYYAFGTMAVAMGDDVLASRPASYSEEEAKARYLELGKKLKMLIPCPITKFEFCSNMWENGKATMIDPSSIIYALATPKLNTPEQVLSVFPYFQGTEKEENFREIVAMKGIILH
jgi:hypothetical protein